MHFVFVCLFVCTFLNFYCRACRSATEAFQTWRCPPSAAGSWGSSLARRSVLCAPRCARPPLPPSASPPRGALHPLTGRRDAAAGGGGCGGVADRPLGPSTPTFPAQASPGQAAQWGRGEPGPPGATAPALFIEDSGVTPTADSRCFPHRGGAQRATLLEPHCVWGTQAVDLILETL